MSYETFMRGALHARNTLIEGDATIVTAGEIHRHPEVIELLIVIRGLSAAGPIRDGECTIALRGRQDADTPPQLYRAYGQTVLGATSAAYNLWTLDFKDGMRLRIDENGDVSVRKWYEDEHWRFVPTPLPGQEDLVSFQPAYKGELPPDMRPQRSEEVSRDIPTGLQIITLQSVGNQYL